MHETVFVAVKLLLGKYSETSQAVEIHEKSVS